MYNYRFEMNS